MQLDHIQLAMPPGEEDAARGFFTDILEMTELEKPADLAKRGGCWFLKGAAVIHVGTEAEFRPQQKAHPAFVVRDVDALAHRLVQGGHAVIWDKNIEGLRRFYTADPFGNRMEFMDGPAPRNRL